MNSIQRVDFYILNGRQRRAALHYLCRLIAKAYQQEHQIFVYSHSIQETKLIDDLLWTFDDMSFIPHCAVNSNTLNNTQKNIPVNIGNRCIPDDFKDILINLREQAIDCGRSYSRIIEMVPDEQPWRSQARNKYAYYREQACELKTFEIK